MMAKKPSKENTKKGLVYIPKSEQTAAQKANNGSNYFKKKFLTAEQKENHL